VRERERGECVLHVFKPKRELKYLFLRENEGERGGRTRCIRDNESHSFLGLGERESMRKFREMFWKEKSEERGEFVR
jgi:hypothetical protein